MQVQHQIIPVACLLLISSLVVAEEGSDLSELQGEWKLAEIRIDEKPAELPQNAPVLSVRGSKILYSGEELATLNVTSAGTSKTIDLEFLKPKKVYEGVYSVDKQTLKICVNNQTDGVKERPIDLVTKDRPNFRLLVFERIPENEVPTAAGFVGMALMFNEGTSEIVIFEVVADSPAEKAGLKKDDVLIKVAGALINDLQSAVNSVRQTKPGSELVLLIRRDGKEREITVKAAVFPFHFFGILD